jgi:hypothetical protein
LSKEVLLVVVPREVVLELAVELLLGRTGKVLFDVEVVVVLLEAEVDGSVVPEV